MSARATGGRIVPEGIRRRLVMGLGANAFGNVVTIAIQLITVPVLLQMWGTRVYGEWLVLVALAAFLAMSDWGFENTAGNEMTAALAVSKTETAAEIFQSTSLLVAFASVAFLSVATGIATLLPFHEWFELRALGNSDVVLVVVILLVHVAVLLQAGVIRAAHRAAGDYAIGAMHGHIARIADAAAVVGTALIGGAPLQAAVLMVFARVAVTVYSGYELKRRNSWVRFGITRATRSTIWRLLPGVTAMMAFPLGLALTLQGMIAVVGLVLGPVAVVAFATFRTLSRLTYQLGGVITNAVWPEMSFAFGSGDMRMARALHRRTFQVVAWLVAPAALVIALGGRFLLHAWTSGSVPYMPALLYLLLGTAVIEATWTASALVMLGSGNHHRIAGAYLAGAAVSITLAVASMPRFGVEGAAASLLAVAIAMAPYVIRKSLAITGDSFAVLASVVSRPPSLPSLLGKRVAAEGVQQ